MHWCLCWMVCFNVYHELITEQIRACWPQDRRELILLQYPAPALPPSYSLSSPAPPRSRWSWVPASCRGCPGNHCWQRRVSWGGSSPGPDWSRPAGSWCSEQRCTAWREEWTRSWDNWDPESHSDQTYHDLKQPIRVKYCLQMINQTNQYCHLVTELLKLVFSQDSLRSWTQENKLLE